MSIQSDFQSILDSHREMERAWGALAAHQWADLISSIMARDSLRRLVTTTARAATALTYCWNKLREQVDLDRADADTPWLPEVVLLLSPIGALFDHETPVGSEEAVADRLKAFASSVSRVLELQAAPRRGEPAAQAGVVTSMGRASVINPDWPDVSLLYEQAEPMIPFLKAVGRQRTRDSWREWFSKRLDSVRSSVPGLIEGGLWMELAHLINQSLDVGLLPVMGTNTITFGASALTPLKALRSFPAFMEKQAVLYRLREYGREAMQLSSTSPVMTAIAHAISSVDWAAVQIAFMITPFATLLTIYSGGKLIATAVNPALGRYHGDAKALIDAADAIQALQPGDRPSSESILALLAICHLAGGAREYVRIMTEHIDDAYADLSRKLDA